MKLIGYARISPRRDLEESVSLDMQEDQIRMYCKLHDIELIDVLRDEEYSGKDLKRPAIQTVLKLMETGEADGICVYKLDRLTRSRKDLIHLMETVFSKGKTLSSVRDHLDTSTATGRLMINFMMDVLEWEREIIGERTREGLRHKKAKGERVGEIPYGKNLAEDGKTLVDNPDEQAVIKNMRELRTLGLSDRKIAEHLNGLGIKTKKAGQKDGDRIIKGMWSQNTVRRVLKKESA